MFDLEKIDTPKAAEAGHEIELIYNGASTGWFVKVRGEFSPIVKNHNIAVGNNFRIKAWQDRKSGNADKPVLMTPEDSETGLQLAAVCIISWRGIVFGGKPFEYSEKNAYELVRRHEPFADQILKASGDIANFTQAH